MASRSLQDGSDLKLSYLVNDDSSLQNLGVVRSNKVLEKELIEEKKSLQLRLPPPVDCYEIEEAQESIYCSKKPLDLQGTLQREY